MSITESNISDWFIDSMLRFNPPTTNLFSYRFATSTNLARLGGNTGPYTLRKMGKDTFILSRDVEAYLRVHDIIDGGVQSKKSLKAAQEFFNQMHQQSGLSLQEISQIIAFSVGDNHIQ